MRIVGVCLVLLAGCEVSVTGVGEPAVEIVVPDGYRGRLAFVHFQQLPDDIGKEDGRYVYRFPESGILCVGPAEHIVRSHDVSIRYANGSSIPVIDWRADNQDYDGVGAGIVGGGGIGHSRTADGIYRNIRFNQVWLAVGPRSVHKALGQDFYSPECHDELVRYCLTGD